jgi:hypothetical protein
MRKAANERLEKKRKTHHRKYLTTWDDQIKQLIEDKKAVYKRWLCSKKVED